MAQSELNQQANLANANLTQQSQQMLNEMTQYYLSQGMAQEQARLAAAMAFEELRVQQQVGMAGAEAAKYGAKMNNQTQTNAGLMGAIGTLGAAAISMSDKRAKKKIKSGDERIKGFLDNLSAYDYEYKDKKHGKGRQVSVMAQDLEKSDLGKQFVIDTPAGKKVDYGKGLAAILAAQAHLNKRLKQVEA